MAFPILLIPGLNCTAEIFSAQLPALWQFGPVMIANHTQGATMAEIARSILAEAPPKFALAGFSMGGYIAFEVMRQASDRVLALALLDTSARPDSPEAAEKRRSSIALAEQGKFVATVQQSFPNAVHPDHVDDSRLRALHVGMARANGPEVYIRSQQAILTRPDSRPDLSGIKVPTLVLVGDADGVTPPDAAREMASSIPGAKLVTVRKAGHLTLAEQPEAVTSAMVGWFGGL